VPLFYRKKIEMQEQFFKGLKVIELASVLAGPAVGMFFSELGAEVIKIENKSTGGDVTRKWKLPTEDKSVSHSSYYCSVNWQKRVLFKNLNDKPDQTEVLELIKNADIIISNFKPASAKKMGMDYKSVRSINNQIIYAELTSYGKQDETPAFDIVMQAEAGFLYMCGEPDQNPVRMPVALIDVLAAHQLKEGILLALLKKMRTGEGSFVTTSLLESAVASLANQATNWLMGDTIPQRMGSQHPNIAPYGDIFLTKDNLPIVLAVGTEKQFQLLCEVLKVEFLKNDNRFNINTLRVKNRTTLAKELAKAILLFDRKPLLDLLKKDGIPAGSIRNMKEVFEMEQAKEMILEETLEDGSETKRVKTVAFTVS
jgi:crotonobetainyl-CoA:carnitine CoA-transferase CaiB-like acyl-CoA transferase